MKNLYINEEGTTIPAALLYIALAIFGARLGYTAPIPSGDLLLHGFIGFWAALLLVVLLSDYPNNAPGVYYCGPIARFWLKRLSKKWFSPRVSILTSCLGIMGVVLGFMISFIWGLLAFALVLFVICPIASVTQEDADAR